MKIEPCTDPQPAELGPSWQVVDARHGTIHLISLAEVMGLRRPPDPSDRRTIARNHLRNLLFDTLRDRLPADSLRRDAGGSPLRANGRDAAPEAVGGEPEPGSAAVALRPGACA